MAHSLLLGRALLGTALLLAGTAAPARAPSRLDPRTRAILQGFNGSWTSVTAAPADSFSLHLQTQGRRLTGSYCAVLQIGVRVDGCGESPDPPPLQGDTAGHHAIVRILDAAGGSEGQAVISYMPGQDALRWALTRPPAGPHALPESATLQRSLQPAP